MRQCLMSCALKVALIIKQRCLELGGKIVVIHKPGCDHAPRGLDNPQPIMDFIFENAR